jgi:hypothetical protein
MKLLRIGITHKVFDRAFTQGLSATRISLPGRSLEDVLRFCTVVDESKVKCQPELLSVGVITLVANDVRQIKFRDDQQYAFGCMTRLEAKPQRVRT